jgi:hypothetical protein
MENSQESFSLQWPFSALVFGNSHSGKTTFVLNLISAHELLFPDVNKIIYVFDQSQPALTNFRILHPDVIFLENYEEVDQHLDGTKCLGIFDDMMLKFESDAKANYYLRHFYCVKSHHLNCSVITIVHNAFPKNFRVISINTTYLVLFRNNRDISFINYINRQVYGCHSKFLLESYKLATSKPYEYLVLDFSSSVSEKLRTRNWFYPDFSKDLFCYIPK